MPQHYAQIAFTDDVKNAQERLGSRSSMRRFEEADVDNARLGPDERAFVQERDGFYLATVGSNGWPYLQFRGGPPGFLHVLDDRTLGWADFRGNRQYITTGNAASNDRASLFLMDHARRGRLKIYGRLELRSADRADPLYPALVLPDYRARVEQLAVVHVEALDWNCSQHITPRFSAAEIAALREQAAGSGRR